MVQAISFRAFYRGGPISNRVQSIVGFSVEETFTATCFYPSALTSSCPYHYENAPQQTK